MQTRLFPLLLVMALAGCSDPKPQSTAEDLPAQAAQPAQAYFFQCESGRSVRVTYPDTDTAIVEYDDKTLHMEIAVSASGARYVGEGMEWWTKGSGPGAEGSLFRQDGDGVSADQTLEHCKEVAAE